MLSSPQSTAKSSFFVAVVISLLVGRYELGSCDVGEEPLGLGVFVNESQHAVNLEKVRSEGIHGTPRHGDASRPWVDLSLLPP